MKITIHHWTTSSVRGVDVTHHRSDRLVLGRSPQYDMVADLAEEQGWQRIEDVIGDGARQVLWAVGVGASLTYVEDPVSHYAYAVLVSEDQETFARVLDVVDYDLMPWSHRTLLTSINEARDPLSRARAVIAAGLGAPEHYDEDFFTRIRDAFGSTEKWVREAAVWATTYSPWPQYRPLLEAVASTDPEEKLRDDAATVLAAFDAHDVGH